MPDNSARFPHPFGRLGEKLRLIRRVFGIAAQLDEIAAQAESATASRAAEHAQIVEILRFIHSQARWRRQRLWELRADPAYERPYTEPDPLISVVIATYDNHRLLRERSIPSILAQTYENFEIVVVGDAAPEAARIAVESFDDPRIRFSNLPYRGPYPSDPSIRWRVAGMPPANEGVRLAKGLWIAFLDDDDSFQPQHLERLLAHARERRLELAYTRLCQHAPDGATTTIGRFPPELGQFGFQASIYTRDLARIFEFELADAALGLPADWAMCLRMMEAGVRMGMLDEETVDYYPALLWNPGPEE